MKMKLTLRRTGILVLFGLIAAISHGQEIGRIERYGVKIGAQVSTIPTGEAYNEFPNASIRPELGFQVGGFATFSLPDKLSLHTELFFSAQGFSEVDKHVMQSSSDYESGNWSVETEDRSKYSVRYAKIPLLVQYAITEKFLVEVGPQFGLFLNSNIDKADWDIFNRFDMAAALGFEYLVTTNISAQLRYAHSFAKTDPDWLWYSEKPRVLSLGVAYAF